MAEQGDELGTQGFQGSEDDPFLLSKGEWYSLQRYVTNALQLPITEPTMRRAFGMPSALAFADFTNLLQGYQTIHPHVAKWRDQTFPATVDLAADLVHYNTAVPTYYGALKDALEAVRKNPQDNDAKETLKEILDDRAQVAQEYAQKAAAVYADIQQFAKDTADDHTLIKGLITEYKDKLGGRSARAQELLASIEAERTIINNSTADYEHERGRLEDVPKYIWVWPIGTIWGAVVLKEAGDALAAAAERINQANARIRELGAEQQMAAALVGTLQMAGQSLSDIQKDLAEALPTIQHIQGVWNTISTDLGALSTLVGQGIQQALPRLRGLKVDEAVQKWAAIAKKADAYRANAFITPPAEMPLAA